MFSCEEQKLDVREEDIYTENGVCHRKKDLFLLINISSTKLRSAPLRSD